MDIQSRKKQFYGAIDKTCQVQLNGIDFIGGTLVESVNDGGEYRGIITHFKVCGNSLRIKTNEVENKPHASMLLNCENVHSIDDPVITEQNGIWYITSESWFGWLCAIAPKGVEIPIKE